MALTLVSAIFLVRPVRLELTRGAHTPLKRTRLPFRHGRLSYISYYNIVHLSRIFRYLFEKFDGCPDFSIRAIIRNNSVNRKTGLY